MALTIEFPEDLAAEVREFFDRLKTGSVEIHIDHGRVVATVVHSHKRIREPAKLR